MVNISERSVEGTVIAPSKAVPTKHSAYVAAIRTIRVFIIMFLAQLLTTSNPYSEQALISATAAGIAAVLSLSAT